MTFLEFLSPFLRNQRKFWAIFILLYISVLAAIFLFPSSQKTSIVFTVNPTGTTPAGNHYYAMEGSERMADSLATWIKSPNFRTKILERSGTYVHNFKNKITARKQGRQNVFITLKLTNKENQHTQKLVNAIVALYEDRNNQLNKESAFDFSISSLETHSEVPSYPLWWFLIGGGMISTLVALFLIYFWEIFRGKISFSTQIRDIFGNNASIISVQSLTSEADRTLIESFTSSLESSYIFMMDNKAEAFSSTLKSLNNISTPPILIVRLGETTERDLLNMQAILGNDIGIILITK